MALLDDYSRNGDNAKLRAFAREILPKVREHLAKAKALQQQIGA